MKNLLFSVWVLFGRGGGVLLLVVDGLLDARPEVWLGEKGGCKGGDGVWPGFQYGAGKDVEHGLEFGVFPQIPFVVYSQHNQLFVQLCLLLPTQQPPLSSLVSRPWRRPIRHRRRSRHAHPTHDVCGRKRAKTGGLTKRTKRTKRRNGRKRASRATDCQSRGHWSLVTDQLIHSVTSSIVTLS